MAAPTWSSSRSVAREQASRVNAERTAWIWKHVGDATAEGFAYGEREVHIVVGRPSGRGVWLQFPGKETKEKEEKKYRPYDCRPLVEGLQDQPLKNTAIWQGLSKEFESNRLSVYQSQVLAAIFARLAYCYDHEESRRPRLLRTYGSLPNGRSYVATPAIGKISAPRWQLGSPEPFLAELGGLRVASRSIRELILETEWIAAQEESKYEWAKQHLTHLPKVRRWVGRPWIGRENFLLTVVKAIGRIQGVCDMEDHYWFQRGDGDVDPAKPGEVRDITDKLVNLR